MTNWKPGMKAVCVDDRFDRSYFNTTDVYPIKGRTYTVRDVMIEDGDVGLRLVEIVNAPRAVQGYVESAFIATGFRPLLGDEQEALDAIEEEVKETELMPA
jgi:hypothetical protein